jgi:enamine deaminase RidA (YjgF/YER057c/UK114 family)
MLQRHNPGSVAPPFSRYSHAVETPAGARWLHVSGQVGVKPDGSLAEGVEAQIEQAFLNIFAALQSAGMSKHDLVKLTVFLTDQSNLPAFRSVRDKLVLPAEPASTLLIVAGLARPEWLVEIEAIAAAA